MCCDQVPTVGSGPVETDLGGELDKKIMCCTVGEQYRCRHFAVHDGHYFFCQAQWAQNCDPDNTSPYPWREAGKQLLNGLSPDDGCPYVEGNYSQSGMTLRQRMCILEADKTAKFRSDGTVALRLDYSDIKPDIKPDIKLIMDTEG